MRKQPSISDNFARVRDRLQWRKYIGGDPFLVEKDTMSTYHKIETLYERDMKTFKVDPTKLKNLPIQ